MKTSSSTSDMPPPASTACVLVIDDEPSICWAFERMLREEGHSVITASSAEEGLAVAEREQIDLILLDVWLPKQNGISALPAFRRVVGETPIVLMTAFGDLQTAVSAVREGARDYLIKPFRLEDARRVCRNALQSSAAVASETGASQHPVPGTDELIGRSPAMQQAFRQIALVADSDLSVLITGETGTGKELVAAAIHRHSHRSAQPYFPIAPVSFNPDLIESELFGHVQGAFTGASSTRAGLLEQAEGGTILLDEIGELPMNIQVKLLRVLEQGTYTRVGDLQTRRCDVRVLAATHRDLHQAVREGLFREDLFYRLNGLQIHLPPLRERLEDIAPLCRYFLQRLASDQPAPAIDESLLEQLAQRPWYGNIRELRNAIGHAAVIARGRRLTIDDFPPAQPSHAPLAPSNPVQTLQTAVSEWAHETLSQLANSDGEAAGGLHTRMLETIEPRLLQIVLEHTAGNRARAAELLGIHRGTLREKLRQYDLTK